MDWFKVITTTGKTLTVKGFTDKDGEFIQIEGKKLYYKRYSYPFYSNITERISNMTPVCMRCKNPLRGAICEYERCGQ
jgi:hypothetical protein